VARTFLAPLLNNPGTAHVLKNLRNSRILATRLIPALDSRTRRRGLLDYDTFDEGSAMFIAPSGAVHTFFMRFPIDVAFVARDGRVLKIRHAVAPWRIAADLRAHGVVELPAGTCARCDTVAGDVLSILPA
jgi:uncharacterized membrane protein (UPF0127 family)